MKDGTIDFSTSIELRVPSSNTICSFLLKAIIALIEGSLRRLMRSLTYLAA